MEDWSITHRPNCTPRPPQNLALDGNPFFAFCKNTSPGWANAPTGGGFEGFEV
jgi:hypothetical protein